MKTNWHLKELLKITYKERNKPIEKGAKDVNSYFTKKEIQMASKMKDFSNWGKCTLKSQWNIISHLSDSQKFRTTWESNLPISSKLEMWLFYDIHPK